MTSHSKISDLFVHVPMFNNQIVPKYAKESSKTLKISCQSVNESGSLFISYLTHTCIRHYDAVLYSNCLEPKPKNELCNVVGPNYVVH